MSVSFDYILVCPNQYLDAGSTETDIDMELATKIQYLILTWSYHSDLLYIYIFLQLSTAFISVPEATKLSLFECS